MELQAEGLVCVRGERRLFEGVSFRLLAGQALWLTGSNGAGKSSLLRLLAGLLPAADGGLLADGKPVANDLTAFRNRLHYAGHLDPVKNGFSVMENLAFWSGLFGESAAPGPACETALAVMGIAHLAAIPARLLSAGQRKRLNLARLVAVRRELWLLDEPMAALDADAIARLEQMIAAHLQAGGLAVIATHTQLGSTTAAHLHLTGNVKAELEF